MMYIDRNPSISAHRIPSFLHRALAGLGILLILLALAPDTAQAQNPDNAEYWKHHIDEQVTELIESSDPALREEGMQLIIRFTEKKASSFEFSQARSALQGIFFNRTHSEQQRLMALSALFALDRDQTTEVMTNWVDEEYSDRVRRHILLALQGQA